MDKILFAIGALIVLAIIIIVFMATRTATMAKKCRGRSGFEVNPDGGANLGPNDNVVLSGGTSALNSLISTEDSNSANVYYGMITPAGNFGIFALPVADFINATASTPNTLPTINPILVIAIASVPGYVATGYFLDQNGSLNVYGTTPTSNTSTLIFSTQAPAGGSGCYELGIDLTVTQGTPQLSIIDVGGSNGDFSGISPVSTVSRIWSTSTICTSSISAGSFTVSGSGGITIPVATGMVYSFASGGQGGFSGGVVSGDQTPIASQNCLLWAYLDNGQTVAGNAVPTGSSGPTGNFIVCQFGTFTGVPLAIINSSLGTGFTLSPTTGVFSVNNKCGRAIAQFPAPTLSTTTATTSTSLTIAEWPAYKYSNVTVQNGDIEIWDQSNNRIFTTAIYPRSLYFAKTVGSQTSGVISIIPNSTITMYGAISSVDNNTIVVNPVLYSPNAFNGSNKGYIFQALADTIAGSGFWLGVCQYNNADWSDTITPPSQPAPTTGLQWSTILQGNASLNAIQPLWGLGVVAGGPYYGNSFTVYDSITTAIVFYTRTGGSIVHVPCNMSLGQGGNLSITANSSPILNVQSVITNLAEPAYLNTVYWYNMYTNLGAKAFDKTVDNTQTFTINSSIQVS